MEIFERK